MADAFDHCEQLVRAGDKDRFLATLFAPPKYRRALFALYAFNLEVARTGMAREPPPGEIRLPWWTRWRARARARPTPIRSPPPCGMWWCGIACRRGFSWS
jgi:phytoene synthase